MRPARRSTRWNWNSKYVEVQNAFGKKCFLTSGTFGTVLCFERHSLALKKGKTMFCFSDNKRRKFTTRAHPYIDQQ